MRDVIAKMYDSESWRDKVRYMHDNQVIAIYYNFSKRGILNESSRNKQSKIIKEKEQKITQQQLSLFDLLNEKGEV